METLKEPHHSNTCLVWMICHLTHRTRLADNSDESGEVMLDRVNVNSIRIGETAIKILVICVHISRHNNVVT